VDGQVVTFAGGSLDAETEQAFQVTFATPADAGEYPVKLIQTCEDGSLDWISVPAEGEPEPEHPAPILVVTEGAPTDEDGHGHDEATTTEADHHAEDTATTEADHHAEETATTEADDHAEGATDDDSDDAGSAMPIVAGVVVAAALVAGGVVLYRRSQAGRGPGDEGSTPEPPADAEPDAEA